MNGVAWLPPDLGSDATRTKLRDELASDPIGVIAVDGVLDHDVVSEMADALEDAVFSDEYRLTGRADPVTASAWREAGDEERLWRVGRLSALSDASRLSDGALALLELHRSADILGVWLAHVLGAQLGDATGPVVTRLDVDHSVRPHTLDPTSARCRVDIVLSRWDERWGGDYVAVGSAERVRRLVPRYGSGFIVDAMRSPVTFIAPRRPGSPPMSMLTMTFASARDGS